MRLSTARSKASANGHDALHALRLKAEKIGAAALPRAASAAESAGAMISDFALSSSRSLARSLHHRDDGKAITSGKLLLQTAPLLRTAARIARRHPLLLASAGVAIALIGYAALRGQPESAAPTP